MGLVPEIFTETSLQQLEGHMSIGHVRYSTTGASNLTNAQPLMVTHKGTTLAVAHNGNLVNSLELRKKLEEQGSIFQTTMDSEVVLHLMARTAHLGLEKSPVGNVLGPQGRLFPAPDDTGYDGRRSRPRRFPSPLSRQIK